MVLHTLKLLKVLSVCPQNKQAIIEAGGIEALTFHLIHTKSNNVTATCVLTLRNLSDVAQKLTGEKQAHEVFPLIQCLVPLLRHQEREVFSCVADTLSNLTCNNAANKIEVCKLEGIQALMYIISHWKPISESICQTNHTGSRARSFLNGVVSTLKHITHGHPKEALAQEHLLKCPDSLPSLMNILVCLTRDHTTAQCPVHGPPNPGGPNFGPNGGPPHWPSLKVVLGLIKNLAQNPENLPALLCAQPDNVVATLVNLVQYVCKTFMQGGASTPVERVLPDDVAELCLGAVSSIAKSMVAQGVPTDSLARGDFINLVGCVMR